MSKSDQINHAIANFFGSPVHMVISFFNQKSKLVAVRESYQNLQSHKPAA
jgi:hypothetical protein